VGVAIRTPGRIGTVSTRRAFCIGLYEATGYETSGRSGLALPSATRNLRVPQPEPAG